MQLGFTALVATMVIANAASAAVVDQCTADMQASVNTLAAYKKCKTDSGFEFSKTAKADPAAFCASQKCLKLFKRLRKIDALSCTAYAGLDSLELWVKAKSKECFKNTVDPEPDVDADTDLTLETIAPVSPTIAPSPATTTLAPASTVATSTAPVPADSATVISECTTDMQASVNTLPAYKKCKTDSGFEFSTTAKADAVAFCASQKCQNLFKKLRQLDALSCTAYAGLDYLELWVKGNPKTCFKNSDDSDTDSDDDVDLTTAPGTTTAPSTTTSPVPSTTTPAQSSTPAPASSGDVIDQCTADLQAEVSSLPAYKKCKADSGFEFSKTAKTDLVAFCASQKCLKLFKRLRKVDALSCTAYAGLDSLKLWEKGNPKECFKNADDSDSDSDEDPDLTSAPGTTTPAPTKTSPAPTTTTPTPTSSDDVIDQCTADMQAAMNALAAYKKCKADSGFELSKTAKTDTVAFCASQKCQKLFKKLRMLDALSCTAYAGLDSLKLWVKENPKECFKNTDDSDSNSDEDPDTITSPRSTAPTPTTTAPRSPTTTPQMTPAPPLTGTSPGGEVGQDADTELSSPPAKTKKPHPTCS